MKRIVKTKTGTTNIHKFINNTFLDLERDQHKIIMLESEQLDENKTVNEKYVHLEEQQLLFVFILACLLLLLAKNNNNTKTDYLTKLCTNKDKKQTEQFLKKYIKKVIEYRKNRNEVLLYTKLKRKKKTLSKSKNLKKKRMKRKKMYLMCLFFHCIFEEIFKERNRGNIYFFVYLLFW